MIVSEMTKPLLFESYFSSTLANSTTRNYRVGFLVLIPGRQKKNYEANVWAVVSLGVSAENHALCIMIYGDWRQETSIMRRILSVWKCASAIKKNTRYYHFHSVDDISGKRESFQLADALLLLHSPVAMASSHGGSRHAQWVETV